MSENELTEEEIVEETLKYEKEESTIDIESAPSTAKAPEIRGSGGCHICGRYTDVPIIDGVPQCSCHTK